LFSSFVALAALLTGSGQPAARAEKSTTKEKVSFGTLRGPSLEEARTQAAAWLKGVGKTDATTQKAFAAIWADGDRPLLDRITDTLVLGDPAAKKLLTDARDTSVSAPTEVPAIIKDSKDTFFKANLAVAYARALANRRVYEEGLDVLKTVKPEQTADPGAYLFLRAVCEHALILPTEADQSILRLLDDVTDAPERYRMVAALMHFDMMSWRDKDLGWIARKMDNIERRLDMARAGPKTQKMQKEVVMRLDEIIKEKENQAKGQGQGQGQGNGGNCPSGGQGQGNGNTPNNNTQASSPQNDSNGGNGSGPGQVDPKKIKDLAEQWGKLPERERTQALLELTRDMPPRSREVIEAYFKKINVEK